MDNANDKQFNIFTDRLPVGCLTATVVVITCILLILALTVVHNNRRYTYGTYKEAEVKQNVHAIQLALERYAVDNAGRYPARIMGGDWTDTQVVWESWVLEQCPNGDLQEMLQYISNPEKHDMWEPAPQDMGDPLVMETYMPSYPGNPFIKNDRVSLTIQIHHFPGSTYPGHPPWWRYVGGRESNKMWEVFGPTFTGGPDVCSNAGDIYVHHIFNNPPYDFESDETKEPARGWVDPSGHPFLTGNFSYYPRLETGLSFYMNSEPDVIGYTLAGYGSIVTRGQDVYNRNGNYEGRFRTESMEQSGPDGEGNIPFPTDIPCLLKANDKPSPQRNNGGSDTIPDGVIITLQCIDLGKSKPVQEVVVGDE